MRAAAALVAAAALAGCGDRGERANMTAEAVAAELATIRIEPGLWELGSDIMAVRAADLPHEVRQQMIGPRWRLRHCITPEQAARPEATFLALRNRSDCVYRDFTVRDGRVDGEMICSDATGIMRGRYQPNGYETRIEMESAMTNGATMTLTVRSRGRRIGDCREDEQ